MTYDVAWARTRPVRLMRAALRGGVLRPLLHSQLRLRVEDLGALPDPGQPAVLVANHASHLDTALILASLPGRTAGRVAVGAAADYFFDVRWRAGLTAVCFNTFPVGRGTETRFRGLAGELLDAGWSLLVFPEGTRTRDGALGPFQSGPARLCLSRGVPGVPVGIQGAYETMPRGRSWPQPGRPSVRVRFGPPLWAEPGESAERFTERLRDAVAGLCKP